MRSVRHAWLFAILLLSTAFAARAQPSTATARHVGAGPTVPSSCSTSSGDIFFKNSGSNQGLYHCVSNVYVFVGTGSGGAIGGSGTANNFSLWSAATTLGNAPLTYQANDGTVGLNTNVYTITSGGTPIIKPLAITGTNTSGTQLTIAGGASTGSANGGGIVFQVTPAGGAGSTVNTYSASLAINGDRTLNLGGAYSGSAPGFVYLKNTVAGELGAAAATNGQLLIGKTGADPVVATLTAGSNITITNGAGSITIASTASGVSGTTGTIDLFPGGFAPDGTGTGNNAATLQLDVSTGTQTTNTPKAGENVLLFDSATDEHWLFVKQLPTDYVSGGTLRGVVKSAATSGNFVMKGGQVCTTDGTTNSNTAVFTAADLSSATAVNGTAGVTVAFTITLTTTGMAANRKCVFFIGRDADNSSDTVNSNDIALISLNLDYTR